MLVLIVQSYLVHCGPTLPKEEGISPLQSIERVWPPRMRKRKERAERERRGGNFPFVLDGACRK